MKRALIVGGGAAGYFGAIRARETNPDADVVLAEASGRPLKKVLISGGGRCNVTHSCFDPALLVKHYPRGERELRGLFARFQPRDTVEWFAERGVELKTEADGRMFPITDSSETIAGCLEESAAAAGVDVRLGTAVREIGRKEGGGFSVLLGTGAREDFDSVLLATGSMPAGHEFARSLGHEITPLAPSLFTFKIRDPRINGLPGLSFPKVELELVVPGGEKFRQAGPLLITHWGLSGPAVLKLSAWAARELKASGYGARLFVNFVPGKNPESATAELESLKAGYHKRHIANQCAFDLPTRFWEAALAHAGIPGDRPWGEIAKRDLHALATQLVRGEFQVAGKGEFKDEFVTCGGVKLSEVDFRTMQSKIVPGLYFAGEVLDIDGITGGFNFQNAWSTSWVAGSHMASEGEEKRG